MNVKRVGKNRTKVIDQIFENGKDFYAKYSSEKPTPSTMKKVKSVLLDNDDAYLTCDIGNGFCVVQQTKDLYYIFSVDKNFLCMLIDSKKPIECGVLKSTRYEAHEITPGVFHVIDKVKGTYRRVDLEGLKEFEGK